MHELVHMSTLSFNCNESIVHMAVNESAGMHASKAEMTIRDGIYHSIISPMRDRCHKCRHFVNLLPQLSALGLCLCTARWVLTGTVRQNR